MQLVIGAGRTAAIQSRFRSVTTATTPSRRRPWASRARQPVGPGVERPIGQGALAVHGRDGVRWSRTFCSNSWWIRRSGIARRGPASPSVNLPHLGGLLDGAVRAGLLRGRGKCGGVLEGSGRCGRLSHEPQDRARCVGLRRMAGAHQRLEAGLGDEREVARGLDA